MHKNRWLIFAHRGMLRLNQPGDPTPGGGTPPVPTPPATPPAEPKTFDQDAVTAIATREHDRGSREGKRQAEEALLQRLGVTSLEDVDNLAALAKAAKDADDANKTQAQRDAEAAKADRAAAAAALAEAKNERHAASLERALTSAGMDAATQKYVTVPGVTVDSTPDEVTAAIAAMKEAQPALFGGGTPTPTPPAGGDPRPPAGGGRPPKGEFGGAGAKRFESQVARQTPPQQ